MEGRPVLLVVEEIQASLFLLRHRLTDLGHVSGVRLSDVSRKFCKMLAEMCIPPAREKIAPGRTDALTLPSSSHTRVTKTANPCNPLVAIVVFLDGGGSVIGKLFNIKHIVYYYTVAAKSKRQSGGVEAMG